MRRFRLNKMKTHLNINLRSVNTLKFSTNYLPLLPNWNYSLVVSKSSHFKFKTLYFYTTSYFFNITLPIDFANFKFDRGSRMFFFTIRLSSNYLKPYLNLVKLLF